MSDHPERVSGSSSRGRARWRSRGRGGVNKGDRSHQFEKTSFIENPVNIKIALSTSTGERSCVLDEKTKLTGIKHIFERRPQEGRSFEGEDGGGGEKGKGDRRRYESSGREKAGSERREDRGRGAGEWEVAGGKENIILTHQIEITTSILVIIQVIINR
ncbi:hypothetical protein NQ314_020427 [Rhamnusium bicolor]|uniref:Uncharacterized protein n=1 Tax=Rhamnusium bicolor TaxID=1586634 RepID=A0AAV8WL28_9CUCU|nr:hypothetical protein NQ314_020427 [Rhamnusium bicolor]